MNCPNLSKCQGCTLLNMPYEKQEQKKRELVESCFRRFKLPLNINNVYMAKQPWEYRNKVIVGFARDKNRKVFSGLYAPKTHKVVNTSGCRMQPELVNRVIDKLTSLIDSMKLEIYNPQTGTGLIRHAMIRYARNTEQIMVVIVTSSKMFPSRRNLVNALVEEFPQISCIYQCVNSRDTSVVIEGEMILLYGKKYLTDELCSLRISIAPSCFYQINHDQCEVLYKKAVEALKPFPSDRVLDTYCGVGSIGLYLSSMVKEVVGVELNKEAIECAKYNARANDITNMTFVAEDSTEFMKMARHYHDHFDVIVLDPPRAGTTETFIENAVALKPKKILYISCDPATFVRDLKKFSEMGYFYGPVSLVDMFAQTEHVECFTVLTPRRLPGLGKKAIMDRQGPKNGNAAGFKVGFSKPKGTEPAHSARPAGKKGSARNTGGRFSRTASSKKGR